MPRGGDGIINDLVYCYFDAKYHYNFWRPVTAIRNGDTDEPRATTGSSWTPFIDTPMHPEIHARTVSSLALFRTVLQAEIGTGPMPTLTTTS